MAEQPTPPTTPPTPPAPAPVQARSSQFILWGAIAAVVVIVLIIVALAVMRPGAANQAQPTKPGILFPGNDTASTPMPEWTLLPSSAQIRPGIYVKIVRPAGLDLFKAAGFDNDFIVTLPVDKIVYVQQGPVQANSLSWIQITDGVTAGWGVQDYVVAYGIKNTP